MRLIYRPIDSWPGKLTSAGARTYSPFDANWQSTLQILGRELAALDVEEAVVQLAVAENAIRLDGTLRGDRKPPEHPGVILSFDPPSIGPLRYACDRFVARSYSTMRDSWRHNLRAIALGLEALRKVERYGIGSRGEQYVGWKQLGSGTPMPAARMSVDEAARLLCDATAAEIGEDPADVERVASVANALWREAAKTHHPDAGGNPDVFRRLTEARDVLASWRKAS